jgi:dienelactone hydrolase
MLRQTANLVLLDSVGEVCILCLPEPGLTLSTGKHSIVNAATGQFSAAVAIHGSMLNAEDMAAIACPVLLMPTSNDTPNDQLEPTLSKTQYGDKCEYHTFSERQHGFMGARGKWEEEPLFKDVLLGVEKTSSFFKKNLADSKL